MWSASRFPMLLRGDLLRPCLPPRPSPADQPPRTAEDSILGTEGSILGTEGGILGTEDSILSAPFPAISDAMRVLRWGDGTKWGDPNAYWGNPSYVLEPGDPGYVGAIPRSTKPKKRMKRQPYLPKDDPGVLAVLVAIDTNLPGALATKYGVAAPDLLRLRHGRYAYGWFIAAKEAAQAYSQSMTDTHASMFKGPVGPLQPLPGPIELPEVPTFDDPAVTTQFEPGFFDFLTRTVSDIKNHAAYDVADGLLMKIEGAEIPPPDSQIVPVVDWEIGASGRPILIVKKGDFQGYTVCVARGAGPMLEIGFSTTRRYEIPLPLPAAGVAEIWKVQVQYRYQNAPFGQKSPVIEIPVRGT